MDKMTTEVFVEGLHVYAYHGVMEQERVVGAWFTVSLTVAYDFCTAIDSDDLSHTISYADLCQVVTDEMAVPSRLLEHVAGRIVRALRCRWPQIEHVDLRISKDNPPMSASLAGAGVHVRA